MNAPLVVLGSTVVTIRSGKCGRCGTARMIFTNVDGRTQCAGCAALATVTASACTCPRVSDPDELPTHEASCPLAESVESAHARWAHAQKVAP